MSNIGKDYFNASSITRDFFDLTVGDYVGIGQYRIVHKSLLVPDEVFKFEYVSKSFSNVIEMDIWDKLRGTRHSRWFCPCVSISSCGTVLIQKHARDAEPNEYPDELPVFLTDVKRTNFGMFDGRFVCRDYGYNLLVERGLSNRMKKVSWN